MRKPEVGKSTRREAVRRLAYVAPAVLTLAARPSFAAAASGTTGTKPRKQ